MQKIRDTIVQKLYKFDIPRLSFVIMLDLCNIANEQGQVDIYYKDMVKMIGCSNAQFYESLKTLEDVGLIERTKKEFKNEIHINIIGNDFKDSKGYKGAGYIDTNKSFFAERSYAGLKAGEIRLYLYCYLRTCKAHYNKNNKEPDKLYYGEASSYKKISKQLGISERMLNIYCKSLVKKKFLSFGNERTKKRYDIITVLQGALSVPMINTIERGKSIEIKSKPLFLHWKHFVKTLCRRQKKFYDEQNLVDTALLINQYERKAIQQGKDIYNVLKNAIINLKDTMLDSKTIHYIMRSLIGLDYANSILLFD